MIYYSLKTVLFLITRKKITNLNKEIAKLIAMYMFEKINVTFVEKGEFKVNELIYPALVSTRSKGVR